jgi:hypothetical protein
MKALYLLASCLLVAAIVACLCGKGYYSKAAQTIAIAYSANQGQAARELAQERAHAAIGTGHCYEGAGLGLAALGLVSWVQSWIKSKVMGRRLTPVPLVTLLVLYLAVQFVLVV